MSKTHPLERTSRKKTDPRGWCMLVNWQNWAQDIAASQLLDLQQEGFVASGFAMGCCIGPVITGILLDTWQPFFGWFLCEECVRYPKHQMSMYLLSLTVWRILVWGRENGEYLEFWQPDTTTTQSLMVFLVLDMLGGSFIENREPIPKPRTSWEGDRHWFCVQVYQYSAKPSLNWIKFCHFEIREFISVSSN